MAYRVNIKRNVVINCSENWTQMEANTEKHIIWDEDSTYQWDETFAGTPTSLPIHGCADGFSRKILWLKASWTNSYPIVLAYLYIKTVNKMGFCPQYIRTDCGTENGITACIQCLLLMSEDAHRYGTSFSNHRIENWWYHMRKGFTNLLIEFLKDVVNENIFIAGS